MSRVSVQRLLRVGQQWLVGSWLVLIVAPVSGGPFELVSTHEPSLETATAAGDSGSPILSGDGRYILFASTANNLVPVVSNGLPARFPAPLNVFLRDRLTHATTLVSVNLSTNGGGDGDSLQPAAAMEPSGLARCLLSIIVT